jgi:hypothetical protein
VARRKLHGSTDAQQALCVREGSGIAVGVKERRNWKEQVGKGWEKSWQVQIFQGSVSFGAGFGTFDDADQMSQLARSALKRGVRGFWIIDDEAVKEYEGMSIEMMQCGRGGDATKKYRKKYSEWTCLVGFFCERVDEMNTAILQKINKNRKK